MKKALFLFFVTAFSVSLLAQDPEPYRFKDFKTLACTPVKNQEKTGTCWCFSATSFLESELIRQTRPSLDLSEMFVVRNVYRQKCENYVRRQGTSQLGEGGLAHDMINAVRDFGFVPEEVFPGKKDSKGVFNHSELEKNLKTRCSELVALGKKGMLPKNWLSQIDSILDAEIGAVPEKFEVEKQSFTPQEYVEYLKIDPSDYVSLTSFTHHPFWEPFILEIPDNFANGQFYNLPLNDLMRCLNFSIQNGFSVEWDADVSNAGFAAKYGLAIVPKLDWKDKNTAQREATFKNVEPEKVVSQELRQQLFDSQETTDDHLMHITGILEDANKGIFYQVKNSWGEISELKGFVHVSESYMRLNTISFTFNKNSLPKDVRRRLGLEAGDVNIDKTSAPAPTQNSPVENRKTKIQPAARPAIEVTPSKPDQKTTKD